MSATTNDDTNRVLALGLCGLGIALAAISLFMPYVDEASVAFSRVAENTMLQTEYGWLNIILIGACALGLVRNVMSPHRVVWPLVVGGLTVASAIWTYVDEETRTLCPIDATTITEACSVAEPGLGIYMLGAGGAAMLASGVFFLRLPPRRTAAKAVEPTAQTRECPHCKSAIRPDASVCPHCRRESEAWTLNDGVWWVKRGEQWLWLDNETGEWLPPNPDAEPAPEGVATSES